ncbi:VOC family protein [Nocardia goodfellowii]|uniref:Enzyme related to lactoylglutathione lyase n=1 Tax=Nocardia goodfellowii TaxID=882446 RepID=A0ABS4QMA5_9NOCA|nr:VOC family protein [Nocardia goodfellowii]MBP2192842.1 putative enzyme related to lactoylglutathione lyase [Nocardia goodfellowii]
MTNATTGIGSLRSVVLDCPEPRKLAEFYIGLLGAELIEDEEDDWVVIADKEGRRIAFQTAPEYQPPRFPDPKASQQIHFDVLVDDVDIAQERVLELGARLVQEVTDGDFRVFADPVGHIFCLMWLD